MLKRFKCVCQSLNWLQFGTLGFIFSGHKSSWKLWGSCKDDHETVVSYSLQMIKTRSSKVPALAEYVRWVNFLCPIFKKKSKNKKPFSWTRSCPVEQIAAEITAFNMHSVLACALWWLLSAYFLPVQLEPSIRGGRGHQPSHRPGQPALPEVDWRRCPWVMDNITNYYLV